MREEAKVRRRERKKNTNILAEQKGVEKIERKIKLMFRISSILSSCFRSLMFDRYIQSVFVSSRMPHTDSKNHLK